MTHIWHNADVKTVSEALVLNGYIGATPQSPSTAISLLTLELYYRMHLQKPLFSAEAFTKVLLLKLEGEPLLLYWLMIVFDGNNSLSQMASLGGHKFGNMCIFDSDFFLFHDYINLFTDEVLSSQIPSSQAPAGWDAP
ncbi:hypothetical protein DFH29DRAFT_998662 [Suillus ampliporus]|nr:hypothetical protein DFH29DRAFT_998662 [Suillus ampliporus]